MSMENQGISNDLRVLNDPVIEFFILADHAEAINGKLYLMGGGWDRLFIQDFSRPPFVSFAIGILVPWNATNIRHAVRITIEDLDRKRPIDFSVGATFVTGRPPTLTEGEQQRALLAVPRVPVKFNEPGAYQAVARIVGGSEQRVQFRIEAAPTTRVQVPGGNA